MTKGTHRLFLPWARRGLAGAITAPLSAAGADMRADVTVTLDVAVGRDAPGARVTDATRDLDVQGLALMGPGDVAGLAPGGIAAMDPPAGAKDMAPNLLPALEFHAPDLPWQFTPGAPEGDQRLSPWIALVCLEDGTEASMSLREDGTHVVTVTPPPDVALSGSHGVLPDLSEAWAWAHVQVTGVADEAQLSTAAVQQVIADEPSRIRSRVICPRNLTPRTSYICALVPVFELGRARALGVSPEDRVLAWDAGTTGPLDVPAYHHWRFSTAEAGDFEALARRLGPQPLGDDVGLRPIDVQCPGFGAPDRARVTRAPDPDGATQGKPFPIAATAVQTVAAVGGALRPAGGTMPDTGPLDAALADVMAQTHSADGRPLVMPPVYGAWAADAGGQGVPAGAPAWLRTLATEVRHRIAAGVGAEIVARHKDALMAEIWEQYSAINQVNARLDRARLSRAVGRVIYDRHLDVSGGVCGGTDPVPDHLAPVLSRVMTQGVTLGEAVDHPAHRPASPAQRRAERRAPPGDRAAARAARAARLAAPPDPRIDEDLAPPEPAVQDVIDDLQAPESFPTPPPVDWPILNDALCKGLDPATTVERRAFALLGPGVKGEIPARSGDALHPVVAAPNLARAMSADLRAMSQDWMLPGLDRVPANAIAMLTPDTAFIEAVMAGANHALTGEMLWRGFPTDRKCTVLRRFWEGSDVDIAPMTAWAGALGTHPATGSRAPGLMLVVRGDLLKRFPQTMIYAARADAQGQKLVPGDVRVPLFRGVPEPDVTFLAFDLTPADVQSSSGGGWFFVVEGPPTQPKFGLDETLDFVPGQDAARAMDTLEDFDWDPTFWGDLLDPGTAADDLRKALDDLRHIPVTRPPNRTLTLPATDGPRAVRWGANAAHMAAICLQRDTRLALHANVLFGETA
ncbi:hypothetical protein [Tateyamaria sp. SN6-1]|uniref:hypothetical protein n=1 Tax=Tateyamaria sp. SN6-1 TaxID=3092148 RepID=UPI0039F5642E